MDKLISDKALIEISKRVKDILRSIASRTAKVNHTTNTKISVSANTKWSCNIATSFWTAPVHHLTYGFIASSMYAIFSTT